MQHFSRTTLHDCYNAWLKLRPSLFVVEPTNRCNLTCEMCPSHGSHRTAKSRAVGDMAVSLHQLLIDTIAATVKRGTIIAHGAGEPLLHPEFPQLLENINRHQNLNTAFLTNGILFDQDWANLVIGMRIASIGFSLNGITRETYQAVCGVDRFDQVLANLRGFLAARSAAPQSVRPRVILQIVKTPLIITYLEAFLEEWVRQVDEIIILTRRTADGRRLEGGVGFDSALPCHRLIESLTFNWQGQAHLCCEDWHGEHTVGRFPDNTLPDIITALRKRLILHRTWRKNKIELCRNCVAGMERRVTKSVAKGRIELESALWRKIRRGP